MEAPHSGSIDLATLRFFESHFDDEDPAFTPSDADDAPAPLPGRVPGEALARQPETPLGPRAIILDCGISRRPHYTHVLLVSPSAESVLGSHAFERLGEIVGRVVGVVGFEWEGIDRLHVTAPGLEWDELLREARDALAIYLSAR